MMRSNGMVTRVHAWRPRWAVLVIGLGLVAALWSGASTSYAGTEADGLVPLSSTELAIVIDPNQPYEDIVLRLAAAGFPTVSKMQGLAARFSNYRLIQVPAVTPAVKQQLLDVDGILGVRAVYGSAGADYPIMETGQVIVKFKPGTPRSKVESVAAQNGCTVARQFPLLNQVYVFDADQTGQRTDQETAIALAGDASVLYSHPDLLTKFTKFAADTIDDPLYPYQWHLNNTGQLPGGVPGADIKATQAWSVTMGQGAIVAVIDDSVQRDHEDLIDNYIAGADFIDADGDPGPASYGDGHGTCVSGLICARANQVGVRGVAPYASLIGIRALGGVTYQDMANAFIFADTNGAMAVNNSWGGPSQAILPVIPSTSILLPNVLSDTIQTLATAGRGGRGMLVLFSAGNGYLNGGQPIPINYTNVYAAIPQVMAVGATLRDDTAACYSSYGPEMSVSAPGGGQRAQRDQGGGVGVSDCFEADSATTDTMAVLEPGGFFYLRGYNPAMKWIAGVEVPDPFALPDFPQEGYTRHFSGTSASCPVATGVAALVFSINPNLTAMEARNLIEHTADKILAPNEYWDPITGQNERYGHGRVNAYRAVQAAQAAKTWPSPIKNIQNVSSQALVRLFWEYPDWDEDGFADSDAAAVLIVRAPGRKLTWTPSDGVEYTVGQQVASGVVVVANSLIDTLDQTGLQAGEYEFAFFTRNGSNYYSWGRRVTVTTAGTVTMPLASISALPTAGRAPLTVHFAAGVIDPNYGVKNLTYQWDFGDGTAISNEVTPDHTYTVAGEYFPQVTVTDSAGLSAKASTRVVVAGAANKPPQASIVASRTSGQAPLPIVFQGIGTDPDVGGFIVRYDWDFGDGSTASGQVVEHVFVAGGTYGVSLTVTDDQGASGSASVLISVTGASSTLAETEPDDALGRSAPQCGLGVPVALLGISLGLVTVRARRRHGRG